MSPATPLIFLCVIFPPQAQSPFSPHLATNHCVMTSPRTIRSCYFWSCDQSSSCLSPTPFTDANSQSTLWHVETGGELRLEPGEPVSTDARLHHGILKHIFIHREKIKIQEENKMKTQEWRIDMRPYINNYAGIF